MTTTLWACTTTFPFSTLHHHPTHRLTANCYFRGSPAGPVSKGNKTSSSLSWWACRDETEAQHPLILTSLRLSIYSPIPPSQLSPRLFFIERKAETCRVCFSPSLGQVPAFKAQVSANRESSFRKTRGGSLGHGGGGEGREADTAGFWSPVWMFSSFKTGWTVCQLPVKQSKTHSSVLTSFVL